MRFHYSFKVPPHLGDTWAERWEGPDRGLLTAWLRGIEMARQRPDLVIKAKADELPVLPWKGGIDKPIKSRAIKVGSLYYLAMWQSLRGEDMDIDNASSPTLTCSRTKATFKYTDNVAELFAAAPSEEKTP